MNNDRMPSVSRELRRIKEEMSGRSYEEIIIAMDRAHEQAVELYECLCPDTEELFVAFTLGRFMYAADIATSRNDEYRSRFAAINKLYLDVYKKRPPKNERQKMKRTELAQPEPIGAKVK